MTSGLSLQLVEFQTKLSKSHFLNLSESILWKNAQVILSFRIGRRKKGCVNQKVLQCTVVHWKWSGNSWMFLADVTIGSCQLTSVLCRICWTAPIRKGKRGKTCFLLACPCQPPSVWGLAKFDRIENTKLKIPEINRMSSTNGKLRWVITKHGGMCLTTLNTVSEKLIISFIQRNVCKET